MQMEMQRDEYNGNVWPWQDVSGLFLEIQKMFQEHPLLEGVTMSYEKLEMRFRKTRT